MAGPDSESAKEGTHADHFVRPQLSCLYTLLVYNAHGVPYMHDACVRKPGNMSVGPHPNPLAHCDIKVPGFKVPSDHQEMIFAWLQAILIAVIHCL